MKSHLNLGAYSRSAGDGMEEKYNLWESWWGRGASGANSWSLPAAI